VPSVVYDLLSTLEKYYYYYSFMAFVQDYLGEPIPEENIHSHQSWSSTILYLLTLSTTIHSNLRALQILFDLLSGTIHFIFHTILHPIIVFFLQHMPIPLQPVLL